MIHLLQQKMKQINNCIAIASETDAIIINLHVKRDNSIFNITLMKI